MTKPDETERKLIDQFEDEKDDLLIDDEKDEEDQTKHAQEAATVATVAVATASIAKKVKPKASAVKLTGKLKLVG